MPIHTCATPIAGARLLSSRRLFAVVVGVALFVGSSALAASRPASSAAPTFVRADSIADFPSGVDLSSVAWGDFNGDGRLDLLIQGSTGSSRTGGACLQNASGRFFSGYSGRLPAAAGAVACGDYDGDGDPDMVLGGASTGGTNYLVLYATPYSGPTYNLSGGDTQGSLAWGDADNDGDLDLLVTSNASGSPATFLERNNGDGTFTQTDVGLTGVAFGAAALADFDGDGDLDIALCGQSASGSITRLYRNDGGNVFTALATVLPGVTNAALAWGDMDGDGDPDLALCGQSASGPITRLYRNDGGTFTDVGAGLPGVSHGSLAWGDFDGDGDLDLLVTGDTGAGLITRIYRNDTGVFTDALAGLPGVKDGAAAWADYDHDGDLDLILTGNTGSGRLAYFYRNDGTATNALPGAPSGLSIQITPGHVTFSWNAAADAETPAAALTYNLRVGTTVGGNQAMSAMADGATGLRRIVGPGNTGSRMSWTLALPPGTYEWGVQAVDAEYAGGAFATGERFSNTSFLGLPPSLTGVAHADIAWGDYDGDGDLDLAVIGENPPSTPMTRVYRNDGGVFTPLASNFAAASRGAVAWGDFDGDGDLDLLVAGGTDATRIYRNDGGDTFTPVAMLPSVVDASCAWWDFDGDGDLDIVVTGRTNGLPTTTVYRNDGAGGFVDAHVALQGARSGAVVPGDFDGDGDPDLFICGNDYLDAPQSYLYRNDGHGSFTLVSTGIAAARWASAAWGDFDGDGDVDLAVCGQDNNFTDHSTIYRNDGGVFTVVAALAPVHNGSVAWGDFDNDGDLDLLVTGAHTTLYRNDGGVTFTALGVGLPDNTLGVAKWGDFDGDGRLDIAIAGQGSGGPLAGIYRNTSVQADTPPAAPSGLAAFDAGAYVEFRWDPSADSQTATTPGLSYNLRVGTSPGANDVVPSLSLASGGRRVVQQGNAMQQTIARIAAPTGTLYWSVQAVDAGFVGSAFAAEQTVNSVLGTPAPVPHALEFALVGANPVRGRTLFRLALPAAERVSVSILDLGGRRIATIADAALPAGLHTLEWSDRAGRADVTPGVYFARLVTGAGSRTLRVVALR